MRWTIYEGKKKKKKTWLILPTLHNILIPGALLKRSDYRAVNNRYIFITGCDSGFGNLAARRLDALGCHVFAGCLTEAGETELSKSCSSRMQPVSLDVSKPDSVRRAFDIVKAKLPPGKGAYYSFRDMGFN